MTACMISSNRFFVNFKLKKREEGEGGGLLSGVCFIFEGSRFEDFFFRFL